MKDVSDGCLYHVSLKVDRYLILSANTTKLYKILESAVARGDAQSWGAEMQESAKVNAAERELLELLKVGLTALCGAEKLPDMMSPSDDFELRLLLCKKVQETA